LVPGSNGQLKLVLGWDFSPLLLTQVRTRPKLALLSLTQAALLRVLISCLNR
jgi:hypothetical protein